MSLCSVAKNSKVARNCVRYILWDIKCLKDGQRTFLKNLDNKGAISICRDHVSAMEVMVEGTRSVQIEKLLRERDISFDVTGTDTGPAPARVRGRSPCPTTPRVTSPKMSTDNGPLTSARNRGHIPCPATTSPRVATPKMRRTLDWKDFYPLYMVNSWMYNLEKQYPSTCTVSAIGKSVEGRDLNMLKISNSDASNTGVWLDGGIHAREWISISVVTFIADYIASNFSTLPPSITNKDWYFMPVVNPDGYHHTVTHDRQWRKSRARFGNTIVGVDLNRNFGHFWGSSGPDISSSGDPNHNNYRGQDAFSEPETSAVKDLILYSGTPFKIFLSFHAHSEVISFPWCYTSDPCPDYVSLLEGGAIMAKAMYEATGRMYRVGNFKDIMYSANGTSIDWSYGTAHIPFSYLVELRSKEHKFLLPKHEIYECCREALSAVMALSEFVETRKCLNCTVFANKNQ